MAMPGVALAQSACTAMWGIMVPAGTGPSYLGYFNNSAGTAQKFTTLSFTLSPNQANALAIDPSTGTPYYFDRTALTVGKVDLNANTTATVGTITPASPDGNGNILGAFVDTTGNLIMMSNAGANLAIHLAIVSKTVATTNAVWQTVTYAGGALPANGGIRGGEANLVSGLSVHFEDAFDLEHIIAEEANFHAGLNREGGDQNIAVDQIGCPATGPYLAIHDAADEGAGGKPRRGQQREQGQQERQ